MDKIELTCYAPAEAFRVGDMISITGYPPRWLRLWRSLLRRFGFNPGEYRRQYYVAAITSNMLEISVDPPPCIFYPPLHLQMLP